MAKFFTEYFHNICKASRQRLQRHYVHLILLLLYIPFHDIATSNSMSSVRILLVVFFIKVNLTTSYVCEGVNSQNIINHIINFIDWSLRSAFISWTSRGHWHELQWIWETTSWHCSTKELNEAFEYDERTIGRIIQFACSVERKLCAFPVNLIIESTDKLFYWSTSLVWMLHAVHWQI